jgi:hypothetical protein
MSISNEVQLCWQYQHHLYHIWNHVTAVGKGKKSKAIPVTGREGP